MRAIDSMPEWARQFAARFLGSRDFDHDTWRQVLDHDCRDWTPSELCECMAWMQSEGQRWAPKTAQALVIALRTYRRKVARSNLPPGTESAAAGPCRCCGGSGWVRCYVDHGRELTLDVARKAYARMAPCRCSRGEHWLQVCREYRQAPNEVLERVAALTELGCAQAESIISARYMEEPCPT